MGYFSNGTEGMDYRAKWCDRCIHAENCAVWDAHLFFNYDATTNRQLAEALDLLIPRGPGHGIYNEQCKMFVVGASPPGRDG